MLQTFNSRYQGDSGNFKIDLTFLTYKYTILNELTMAALIAAPHMYKTRISRQSSSGGQSKTTQVNEVITERGYQKIKEMYSEYKSKGLIPDDLPELTLVQLKDTLDTFIKNKLDTFTKQNLEPISACDDYQKQLTEYTGAIYYYVAGKVSWFNRYMDKNNFFVLDKTKTKVYTFKKEINTSDLRRAAISDLESLINEYNQKLNTNPVVGEKRTNSSEPSYKIDGKPYHVKIANPIVLSTFNIFISINSIDVTETFVQRKNKQPNDENQLNELKAEIASSFSLNTTNVTLKDGTKVPFTNFFVFEGTNSFIDLTDKMGKDLKVIREEIEQRLTDALSSLLQNKNEGLGFIPSIRNILAVVFANGEAFLRMLDDVHTKAWDLSNDRLRKQVILDEQIAGASPETFNNGDNANTPIYPWPQYIIETTGEDGHEKYELRYLGDASLISKTKGYLYDVWPEVEFVEEFVKGFAERKSPPAERKNDNEISDVKRTTLNAIEFPIGNYVYSNQEEVKFFYEIYERILFLVNYSKLSRAEDVSLFTDIIVKFVSEYEKINIKNALEGGSPFIVDKLKNYIINSANFETLLRQFSNNGTGQSWQNFIRGIFNTQYIRNLISNSEFEFLDVSVLQEPFTLPSVTVNNEDKIQEFISSTANKKFDFTDTFPFTNSNWTKTYLAQSSKLDSPQSSFITSEILKYNKDNKIISNFLPTTTNLVGRPFTVFAQKNNNEPKPITNPQRPTNSQVSDFFKGRTSDKQSLTEGTVRYFNYSGGTTFEQTTSILNTPYFVNSIQDGLKRFRNYDKNPFVASAYLFLNSLPLATLKEKYSKYESDKTILQDYIFATLKKFGAVHRLPYAWILKYGSIWHRYKKFVEDGTDILENSWKNFDYVTNYDPITSASTKTYNLTINTSPIDIVLESNTIIGAETSTLMNVGFYPKLINDFSVFLNGYEIIQSNSQINGTCEITGTTLVVAQVNVNTLQAGYTLAGINILPNTTIISQIDGTPGGAGSYLVSTTQIATKALFSVTNTQSVGYTSTNIQNALNSSGLTMDYVGNAIIDEREGFDPNNPLRDLRIIPWTLTVESNEKSFYYLLPSCGSLFNQTRNECFNTNNKLIQEVTGNTSVYNGSVRLFWTLPNYGYFDNSRIKKVNPDEYLKRILTGDTFQDAFTLTGFNNESSKLDEVFSVFEKEILDGFEIEFLRFSKSIYDYEDSTTSPIRTSVTLTSTPQPTLGNSPLSIQNTLANISQIIAENELNNTTNQTRIFKNFQNFMRTILKIPKTTGVTSYETVSKIQSQQFVNVQDLVGNFLNVDVTFKFGNPSNYDRQLFTNFSLLQITDRIEWEKYVTSTPNSLPTLNNNVTLSSSQINYPEAWSALKTYVGFSEIPELKYKNSGSYITDFFIDLNIAFIPDNIKELAPIIKIYATQKLNQFQENYIPPPNNPPQEAPYVVATANLKSGSTVNVDKLGTKFRSTYYNSDNVLLYEGAYQLPPSNDVFTVSGSDVYYQSLINQTIIGIFGSLTTNPTDPQFIIRFDRVVPPSYSPEPKTFNSDGSIAFLTAMTNYLNKVEIFQNKIIDSLMINVRNSLDSISINPEERADNELQGEPQPKLELWEIFKSLNDKWIAGNDFKTKTLFEDVLLLDRASRHIGDKILVDIYQIKDRLQGIIEKDVNKQTMLTFVQTILTENNFVVMNIPSYVNFYGVQDSVKNPKPKIDGTLEFANSLFGTFLNVDYRDSTAKMVCFYANRPSEQLDLKNNVDYRKRSDAFELRRASDNPLIENQVGKNDWDKSNKVVGFNVDIGPQNQGIFNSFSVGQDQGKATSESLQATNNLVNQGNNRGGSSQSVSLYNLYKNRSYTCEVEMMGNALIQPTMYFNLRNVPMFSGPYMILDVTHTIGPGRFSTRFSGIRQPTASLPKIDNFIQSLKQKLVQTIIEKNKQEKDAIAVSAKTNSVSVATAPVTSLNNVGTTQNCTAITKYNLYVAEKPNATFITLQNLVNEISNRTDSVLIRYCMFARIYIITGGESIIQSYDNNFAGITLTYDWGVSESFFSTKKKFYCTNNNIPLVFFDSLATHLNFMFGRWQNYPSSLKLQNNVTDITKFVIITQSADFEKGKSFYNSQSQDYIKKVEAQVQTAINLFNSVNR
jgi:hypothetical protein